MVGPWPLAPHHDHLQYIHHVHLMQRGQNRGVTILNRAHRSVDKQTTHKIDHTNYSTIEE